MALAISSAQASAQCTNLAGTWSASESGSVTLSLIASDGESVVETDPISANGTVTITQTGSCTFQYTPIPYSGSTLLNGNLNSSQLASLNRTVTESGNNVQVAGIFAVINTAAAAGEGLTITTSQPNSYIGIGQVTTNASNGSEPTSITLNGSGAVVVAGTLTSNGQTVSFTLTITASSTATLFPSGEPLQILTSSIPSTASGQAYSTTLLAAGGSGMGYVWSYSGMLPDGFTLSPLGVLSSSGNPAAQQGTYNFSVDVTDSAEDAAPTKSLTLLILCPVNVAPTFSVYHQSAPMSGNQLPAQIQLTLTSPTNQTLVEYATACGFSGFDWQQTQILNQGGEYPESPNVELVTPPPFLDPPPGGWAYEFPCGSSTKGCDPKLSPLINAWLKKYQPNFASANPFYYNPTDIQDGYTCLLGIQNCPCTQGPVQPPSCTLPLSNANTLNFVDEPTNSGCMPPAPCQVFQTQLVGLCAVKSMVCPSPGTTASVPLVQWNWSTNYNGAGVGGITVTSDDPFPPDPSSGNGGIAIMSVNGVLAPTVTVVPSASTVSTGESLSVTVTVSGNGSPSPAGSVVLTSGTYSSSAATLGGGNATINVPAGVLPAGTDTLTVAYTPDSGSASIYASASGSASVVVTGNSVPPAATPTFSIPAGTYASAQTVTISDATTGATIYYTTDGTSPTTNSTAYAGAITVNSTETIEAIATASGYSTSAVASATYTISSGGGPPAAAAPTFSIPSGTYASTQTVTISDATAGATIYYTTDGTTPTASSTPYAGAITVSSTETIEAIAIANGYSASAVTIASYRIGSMPTFTTLASFNGTNGANPFDAALVQATDGNFYGTTADGGAGGGGTVFKITPAGALTTLYGFCAQAACTDGSRPIAGLAQARDGNFYGTTAYGGTHQCSQDGQAGTCGTVFKITSTGTLTTLYDFGGSDGSYPVGVLVQGNDGNLYGTSLFGGAKNLGTVFKITTGGALTTLHSFSGSDGSGPGAGLIQASDGNFYGTTLGGGTANSGTIFKMTPEGALTTLYSFCAQAACANGSGPGAGLIQASDGNLYGTASEGGAGSDAPSCDQGGGRGYGTVFKITLTGSLITLHTFQGSDGSVPDAGLIQASDGNFYGITACGGTHNAGTVFEMSPGGALITLQSFPGPAALGAGANGGALVQGANGSLYGTTTGGGTDSDGTVFSLSVGLGAAQSFTISAASGSSTSQTVAPGGTATYVLSVTPQGGFSGSLALSCSGAPAESTCSVSPGSVTLNGGGAASATVSVATQAPSLVPPRNPRAPSGRDPEGLLFAMCWLVAMMAGLLTMWRRKLLGNLSPLRLRLSLVLLGALLLALTLPACGGSGGNSAVSTVPANPGTAAGTYALTVTATSGSGSSTLTKTISLTLTVN